MLEAKRSPVELECACRGRWVFRNSNKINLVGVRGRQREGASRAHARAVRGRHEPALCFGVREKLKHVVEDDDVRCWRARPGTGQGGITGHPEEK